jgi:hypothetical protein
MTNENTNNIKLFEPNKELNILVTYTPDAFCYREKTELNGEKKPYKIYPLKKYFARIFSKKQTDFLKSHNAVHVPKKYGMWYLPDLNTGFLFQEYASGLKEEVKQNLEEQLRKANKKKNIKKVEDLEKKINYLEKHWEKNKPLSDIIVGFSKGVQNGTC